MNGLIIIDKPEGLSSFGVVKEVRRSLGVARAGHTGTLDPMATGVLPVCVGSATKIAGFIVDSEKIYEATVCLGRATDTQDRTGKTIAQAHVPELSPSELEQKLQLFRGEIDQTPPMFSAIKSDGKRLYELARQGKEVERTARKINVYELSLLHFELPNFRIRVRCSKGTYIRTLAHDIGVALGCPSHLASLRRTSTCGYTIERAVNLEFLRSIRRKNGNQNGEPLVDQEAASCLINPRDALSFLPEIVVDSVIAAKITRGQQLSADLLGVEPMQDEQKCRLTSLSGELLAVIEWNDGRIKYLRVLIESQAA